MWPANVPSVPYSEKSCTMNCVLSEATGPEGMLVVKRTVPPMEFPA